MNDFLSSPMYSGTMTVSAASFSVVEMTRIDIWFCDSWHRLIYCHELKTLKEFY